MKSASKSFKWEGQYLPFPRCPLESPGQIWKHRSVLYSISHLGYEIPLGWCLQWSSNPKRKVLPNSTILCWILLWLYWHHFFCLTGYIQEWNTLSSYSTWIGPLGLMCVHVGLQGEGKGEMHEWFGGWGDTGGIKGAQLSDSYWLKVCLLAPVGV